MSKWLHKGDLSDNRDPAAIAQWYPHKKVKHFSVYYVVFHLILSLTKPTSYNHLKEGHTRKYRDWVWYLKDMTINYLETLYVQKPFTPEQNSNQRRMRTLLAREGNLAEVQIEIVGDTAPKMIRSRRVSLAEKVGYFGEEKDYTQRFY